MSRAHKAGLALGQVIIEMVHLMYQNQTAKHFYEGLFAAFNDEFERQTYKYIRRHYENIK